MHSYYPPNPYDTKRVQPDRTAFLDALDEMDDETRNGVHGWIVRLASAIFEKQQTHFKNFGVAYNDAVFVVSRIIWNIGR